MTKKETIYIIGGGIIGCSTAYYLSHHSDFDRKKQQIIIIECNDIAAHASGKAGGLLANWAFPKQLGQLSFKLHNDLATKYNGKQNWDYIPMKCINLENHLNQSQNITNIEEILPQEIQWAKPKHIQNWEEFSDEFNSANINPYKFTKFILQMAQNTQSVEILKGNVSELIIDHDHKTLIGFKYFSRGKTLLNPTNFLRKDQSPSKLIKDIKLNVNDKIILCTGPWTGNLIPNCPISGHKANSIILNNLNGEYPKPCGIFNEIINKSNVLNSPEIYIRKNDIYISNHSHKIPRESMPDPSSTVEPDIKEGDNILKLIGSIWNNNEIGSRYKLYKRQACHLPTLDIETTSGPIIGETNIKKLFISTGHSCWGINNSLISGKLMAEIILNGKIISCHSQTISQLDPNLYFNI